MTRLLDALRPEELRRGAVPAEEAARLARRGCRVRSTEFLADGHVAFWGDPPRGGWAVPRERAEEVREAVPARTPDEVVYAGSIEEGFGGRPAAQEAGLAALMQEYSRICRVRSVEVRPDKVVVVWGNPPPGLVVHPTRVALAVGAWAEPDRMSGWAVLGLVLLALAMVFGALAALAALIFFTAL